LSSKLLFLWHVKIINEDHELLANRWAVDAFSSLFEFIIEIILGLVGRGLCGESNGKSLILLRELISKKLGDVG
jgi:hypothetical protein